MLLLVRLPRPNATNMPAHGGGLVDEPEGEKVPYEDDDDDNTDETGPD